MIAIPENLTKNAEGNEAELIKALQNYIYSMTQAVNKAFAELDERIKELENAD